MERSGKNIIYEEKLIAEVIDLFKKADSEIEGFKAKTALECPSGCGHCCEKVDLEATILEFMPLAIDLWRTKQAEFYLEEIQKLNSPSRCVFYEPGLKGQGLGRCKVYRLRGLICRLFGFSGSRDKKS
ncbi:MAG: YkgJ family cysteine cluster protein, partial [Candidatus Omnitrophica bacterium]|nr:YkgJ family cysteine cluster protein [Candidatus Omnitrophota bacterium]